MQSHHLDHHFFLILLLLIAISLSSPICLSSSFSTLSITRVHGKTIVCALVSHPTSPSTTDLVCRPFPHGELTNYSSEGSNGYTGPIITHVQYSAVAAASGFLCGVRPSMPGKFSMMWWYLDSESQETWDSKRVYWGPLRALSSGDSHVCGLVDDNGTLKCWWWDEVKIPDDIGFKSIAVGREFVCGITTCSGLIRCFGNDTGVVGEVPTGSFQILAAGSYHACAITDSDPGNLTCWGSGAPEIDSVPADLLVLSLGTNTTCILTSNGTVRCWGRDATVPRSLAAERFVSIEAKGDSVCGVLMSNYSVICWGNKNFENGTYKQVYEQIQPGTCVPQENCTCNPMSGSANLCAEGYVICHPCSISLISNKINVPSPPANPASPADPPPAGIHGTSMRSVVMIVGISGGVLASSAALAGFLVYKSRKKKDFDRRIIPILEQISGIPPSLPPRNGFGSEQFTFQNLYRATNGFADGNKIGSGGFGTVYLGVLLDGRQAALKRAHRRRRRHVESAFLSELALLSRLNHRNLVGLMGFCEERGERVLVVEYMPNGTLHDHLHKLQPESSPLFTSWTSRLQIALDAARGIEYLHSYAVPGIIHRDIKPSNILLDSTWTAKVSDFGLSMARTTSTGDCVTPSAGTVGYMDPEYYRRQELTEKSDVYSFGVVLLEMITGLKAVFKTNEDDEPRHVKEYVMSLLNSGDTERIFDRRVPMRDAREEEAVHIVVKLAAQCVRDRGRARPAMKEIVMELEWAVGLCSGDDDDTVEVVLEVEDQGSRSTASSMSRRYSELEHM